MSLHVFTNCEDKYIAESPEEAKAMWKELNKGEMVEDYEDDDWYQCKDDEYLNIVFEDEEEPKPPQAMELREHPGTWRATMRQWADFNGKGFLCSINY